MLPTYEATLKDNRLEWIGEKPDCDETVHVYVTFLVEQPRAARGRQMAEALSSLAAAGGIPAISDPQAWQREQRQDRTLPGRIP